MRIIKGKDKKEKKLTPEERENHPREEERGTRDDE